MKRMILSGTLAKEASEQGFHVKVISGDKDLLQLVSDDTLVCIPRKGITDIDEYTKKLYLRNIAYHRSKLSI